MTTPTSADAERAAAAARIDDLMQENERLREAVAARDAFLAVAAHELRNPMTPIVGRVQRLRRLVAKPDFQPESLDKNLAQIEWLVAQYVKRATALLDVSRVTTGQFRLDPSVTDLSDLVREVRESFGPVAEHAGSSIVAVLPDRHIVRFCDRLAIEQILDNLVSNAIKYAAGSPILIEALEDAQGCIVLRVEDRGSGISPESQARIFERFERAVGPAERSAGFGVGLWIVRQLAETMGGTVAIDSRPDHGSTFIVTLPLPNSEDIR